MEGGAASPRGAEGRAEALGAIASCEILVRKQVELAQRLLADAAQGADHGGEGNAGSGDLEGIEKKYEQNSARIRELLGKCRSTEGEPAPADWEQCVSHLRRQVREGNRVVFDLIREMRSALDSFKVLECPESEVLRQ